MGIKIDKVRKISVFPTILFKMSELYPDNHSEQSVFSEDDAAVGLRDRGVVESAEMITLRGAIRSNKRKISELVAENNVLTTNYILKQLRSADMIAETIDKIGTYLKSQYDSGFESLLSSCRDHLTAMPVKNQIIRISKYGTRVHYDTVMYEWDGKRVAYVRANQNDDYYYDGCADWNGFTLKEFELSEDEKVENYVYMWNTETAHNWSNVSAIERNVNLQGVRDFSKRLVDVPPEFQLIVALFDKSEYCHYLISEDVIDSIDFYRP